MAANASITTPNAVEAPKPNVFATRFIDLLTALAQHIHAERALDRAGLGNPGYSGLLDTADAASLALYEVLAEITAMPAPDPVVLPLRRMALIIATLVREGTATAFRRYAGQRDAFAAVLAVPGDGPDAAQIRHMLAAAEKRIDTMAALSLYRQDGVSLEAEPAAA